MMCKDCIIPMVGVMSFSKDNHEKFCQCPVCYKESKRRKVLESELNFREVLGKAIQIKI